MTRSLLLACLIAVLVWAFPAARAAERMQPTMYDDGMACPGGCDPHVVFARRHNGTDNAFRPPLANRVSAKEHPCVRGELCMICFEADDASCMEVRYRGNGPEAGRFDFSAAFMLDACKRTSELPSALQQQCAGMERTATRVYGGSQSCIADSTSAACAPLIDAARAAQAADRPEYLACVAEGPAAYNRTQADPKLHRSTSNGCAYWLNVRGANSRGQTWQKLAPGACSDGSFVGQDGLDCCTGVPLIDANFGRRECAAYYLRP